METKHELFAIILSDEENVFNINLDKLAFKKSSNKEILSHIKKEKEKRKKNLKIEMQIITFSKEKIETHNEKQALRVLR